MLIGSGESNSILKANYPSTGENMVVGGDNQIDLISNLQNGWGGRRTLQWSDGKLTIDAHLGNTTQISKGDSNSVRLSSSKGYIDVGPMNESYAHIYTNMPSFYFNKDINTPSGTLATTAYVNSKISSTFTRSGNNLTITR